MPVISPSDPTQTLIVYLVLQSSVEKKGKQKKPQKKATHRKKHTIEKVNPERKRSSKKSFVSETMPMIFHTSVVLGIYALVLFLSLSHIIHAVGLQRQLEWMPVGSTFKSNISESLTGGEVEALESLDSEISRRILARTITYRAMQKDPVPCSLRSNGTHSSYQFCQGHAQPNPYRRGCCPITRCRSGRPGG